MKVTKNRENKHLKFSTTTGCIFDDFLAGTSGFTPTGRGRTDTRQAHGMRLCTPREWSGRKPPD